jgi:hypothetical protein
VREALTETAGTRPSARADAGVATGPWARPAPVGATPA